MQQTEADLPNSLSISVLSAILAVLLILGILEAIIHRFVLARLPVRIHVNGTRGKTSVARLIAAGLRAGGYRVCAKTTGSFACVTGPDGRDYPIHRSEQPNIIEQLRIMYRLVAFNPEVIVIECMALNPRYQMLSERQMVRSTHGVITNARPDHLDVMGPTPEDVALALAGSTPFGTKLFTAERKFLDIFERSAAERNTTLHTTSEDDVAAITEKELDGFRYTEHAENVALALKVCEDLGVNRNEAIQGMQALPPEIGATRILQVQFYSRSLIFVNAFAANDPESTEMIWERVVERYGEGHSKIALVNCRFDRPQRSQQLAEVAAKWTPADHYILMGTGTLLFVKAAIKHGMMANDMTITEGMDSDEIFENILAHSEGDTLIVGMCNVKGPGAQLSRFFSNRASMVEEV
ncbi:MAG: poly-gamma-glutamate synthase PgsB [Pseudomonadales bacterium]|nr:poly-gamma-glutamate synthase PgsB [Pseudomonadales bacterium]